MCGGNKGQSTSTYQPNPATTSAITGAIGTAQNAAAAPFQQPVAPVAGFSPDQLAAFQTVNNSQGMANPYFTQASNLFGQSAQAPNINQFFNPLAGAVGAQMQNLFGEQASQNTGQLTQAAGGVGADRIAIGQGDLANRQGLAAGQTFASLFQPALGAAQQEQNILQSAAYGYGALGPAAQNTALQGAQAQLGTGGLQQQLQQAQLNAPYQNELARLAYPFQTSNFLSGTIGALAPGLGGTTTGQAAPPNMFSQIAGAGIAGLGLYNGLSGSGGGNFAGPTSVGGAPLSGYSGGTGYANSPFEGPIAPAARGGAVYPYFDGGGTVDPFTSEPMVPDTPIDSAPQSVVPDTKPVAIKPVIPQLPNQGGSGSSGPSMGDMAKMGMQMAMMFAQRGGAIPYADGGDVTDKDRAEGIRMLRGRMYDPGEDTDVNYSGDMYNVQRAGEGIREYKTTDQPLEARHAYADGGTPDFNDRFPASTSIGEVTAIPPSSPLDAEAYPYGSEFNPWRMPSAEAVQAEREGNPRQDAPVVAADDSASPAGAPTRGVPSPEADDVNNASQDTAGAAGGIGADFAKSPWLALAAAGLGMMGGTSPWFGVNIGKGGLEGVKTLEAQRAASQKDETIAQSAKRLAQEAEFHKDQFTKSTPYQKFEMRKPFTIGQHIDPTTYMPISTYGTMQPDGSIKPIDTAPGNPDAAIPPNASPTQGWIPGQNVPQDVNPNALAGQDEGIVNMVRSIDEGRSRLTDVPPRQRFMVERLLHKYDPRFDQTIWNARNKQQADLDTNGTAGKMLTSVNQLLPHLGTAYDKATELANKNYPEANTIKNWWLTATGDSRVKTFNTVREVASMDAARLLRGSGQMAEKDIEAWRENIANTGSPAQLHDVIKLLADDLIGARISSLQHAYRMNMRQEPPEFLSPEAKEALARIKTGVAKPATAAAPAAAPAAPAAGGTPQVGERRQFKQGWGVWNGRSWAPE